VKLFISCDMEGVSGVVAHDDTKPGTAAYERFRKVMTDEVNAAIEGAFEGGFDKAVVNDSHNGMRNVLIEDLDPRAELISGSTKPLCMMEGVDKTFDLAMYVGYHAMAGTAASIMDHTFYGRMTHNIWINGKRVGEAGINSGIAGYYGVPVGLITGDDKAVKQGRELHGDIEGVVVKYGIDKYVARCLPLSTTRLMIREGAKKAAERRKDFKPLKYSSPVTFKVEFATASEAARARLIPLVKDAGPRVVTLTQNDYIDAFHLYLGVISLAGTVQDPAFG
jgi:D-amino peptidase